MAELPAYQLPGDSVHAARRCLLWCSRRLRGLEGGSKRIPDSAPITVLTTSFTPMYSYANSFTNSDSMTRSYWQRTNDSFSRSGSVGPLGGAFPRLPQDFSRIARELSKFCGRYSDMRKGLLSSVQLPFSPASPNGLAKNSVAIGAPTRSFVSFSKETYVLLTRMPRQSLALGASHHSCLAPKRGIHFAAG